MNWSLGLSAGLVMLVAALSPALAKQARCYTTDDGYYDCSFEPLGGGSFEIAAEGYPSFQIVIDTPGVAFGYGRYEEGGNFVALPGTFRRNADDGACWDNDETGVQICAW